MKLLLDEHHDPVIAEQLRARGHDVVAVVETHHLRGLPDPDLLRRAAADGRALVTENAVDLVPAATDLLAAGEHHSGLILTSPKSLPRSPRTIGRLVSALVALLDAHPGEDALRDRAHWLQGRK